MNKTVKVILVTVISFAVYFYVDELYFKTVRKWLNTSINQVGISHIIAYAIFGIPLFIGCLLLHGRRKLFHSLGLDKSIVKAAVFALVCTLPMYLGFAAGLTLNTEVKLTTVLITVVAAGFFEELYFRGFLFGQPFRYTRLGFLFSVFFGALLFGLIHLYQGNELMEWIGIFLVTFLGGILFAWTYVEWDYNLWVPIFLHMFMNFAWELFDVSENALGDAYPNVFRAVTIALIIVLTIWYKRRNRIPFEVNRRTIFMKTKNTAIEPL